MYIYDSSTETEEPGRQNSKQLTTSTPEKGAKTGFSLMLFFLSKLLQLLSVFVLFQCLFAAFSLVIPQLVYFTIPQSHSVLLSICLQFLWKHRYDLYLGLTSPSSWSFTKALTGNQELRSTYGSHRLDSGFICYHSYIHVSTSKKKSATFGFKSNLLSKQSW